MHLDLDFSVGCDPDRSVQNAVGSRGDLPRLSHSCGQATGVYKY